MIMKDYINITTIQGGLYGYECRRTTFVPTENGVREN